MGERKTRLLPWERDLLSDLESAMLRLPCRLDPVLPQVLPEVQRLLHGDRAFTYLPQRLDTGWSVEFDYSCGDWTAECTQAIRQVVGEASQVEFPSYFNPMRPERTQQNVTVSFEDLRRTKPIAPRMWSEVYIPHGLHRMEQVRVLVCDKTSLLAWVGVLSTDALGTREKTLFDRIVPALRVRLSLERELGDGSLAVTSLPATLECVSGAAFIIRWNGRNVGVQLANSVGLTELAIRRGEILEEIARSIREPGLQAPFKCSELDQAGILRNYLVVQRTPKRDPLAHLDEAKRRFKLTHRQGEVVVLLARGLPNKTIADELGCTQATVEQHVTALMNKLDVGSRAEAAALFWSELGR